MPVFLKFFPKICRGRNTSRLILQGHNHPDTKTSHGEHKKRELQANITGEHRRKNLQQNSTRQNSTTHKKLMHHDQVGLFQGCKDSAIHTNQLM